MNRNKQIGVSVVGELRFLLHSLIGVSGSCVLHIISVSGQDIADGKSHIQIIVAFSPTIVDSSGIADAVMSGIDHYFFCHRISPYLF